MISTKVFNSNSLRLFPVWRWLPVLLVSCGWLWFAGTASALPVFTTQPTTTNVATLGTAASFKVVVVGAPPMVLQWRRNGVNIPGTMTSSSSSSMTNVFAIPVVTATNAGSYSAVVTDANGVADSTVAQLLISALPSLNATDLFASRPAIAGANGFGRTTNSVATKEAGEPDHAGVPGGASVWLQWTAPSSGIVMFDTRGSAFDTLLAVYTGGTLATLTPVAGDDDRGSFLNSKVTFNATVGTTYNIAVDGFYGDKGNIVLNWSLITTPDLLAVITGQPQSATVGDNAPLTLAVTVAAGGPTPIYQWFFNGLQMNGETNATLTIPGVTSAEVGGYVVRILTVGQSIRTNFSATARVQINAQDGGVNYSSAAKDKFHAAMSPGNGLGGYVGSQVFNTFNATRELGEPNHAGEPGGASYWFSYRAPASGTLSVSTPGMLFNHVVAIYTGTGSNFATLTLVTNHFVNFLISGSTALDLAVSNGVTYRIAVDGQDGASGVVVLNYQLDTGFATPPVITTQPSDLNVSAGDTVTICASVSGSPPLFFQWQFNGANLPDATNGCLTIPSVDATNAGSYSYVVYNSAGSVSSTSFALIITNVTALTFSDSFLNRTKISAASGVRRSDNFTATRELFEPLNHGGKPGNASVWLEWTAPDSGIVTFDTRGSGFDTTMSIYTNNTTNINTLGLLLDGDDDSGGFLASSITFNATEGVKYHIAIDGFYGARGYLTLRWLQEATSDLVPEILMQPRSVTVPPGTSVTLTVLVDASNPNIQSIEYQWQRDGVNIPGAVNSVLTISSATPPAGNFTVKITQTVFGSNNPRTITSATAQVQVNTRDGGFDPDSNAQSKFRDASDPGTGLNVGAPAAGYSGSQLFSTVGAVKEPGEPNHCSEPGGASYWYSYQPPANGTLTVDATSPTFNNVLAIYTGTPTNFMSLVSVACSSTNAGTGKETAVFAVTNATIYYIVTDGVGGASGSVTLAYTLAAPPIITSQPASRTVVAGSNATLTVTATGTAPLAYQWRTNGINYTGRTTNSMTVTNFTAAREGGYAVVITNTAGAVTSVTAQLYFIASNNASRFTNYVYGTNKFTATLLGNANTNYIVQGSTNFSSTWTPISTNSSAVGIISFTETNAPGYTNRFYRARTL